MEKMLNAAGNFLFGAGVAECYASSNPVSLETGMIIVAIGIGILLFPKK